jgi:hypothetical protein
MTAALIGYGLLALLAFLFLGDDRRVGDEPWRRGPAMCKADPASVCSCDEYDILGRCPRRP